MIDTANDILSSTSKREEQFGRVLEKVYAAAQPGAVYSEPVRAGNSTVITASEVTAAGGFGSGMGFGPEASSGKKQAGEQVLQPQQVQNSGGGGVGGGGASKGRPVAVIIIGPDKVTVQPVIDVTQLALAGIAVWGTMLMLFMRMWRITKH